jgi:ketosteroid isomerase-like protein
MPLSLALHPPCQQTPPNATEADLREIRQWLESFSKAVREKAYARGKALFAPEVFAFGTRTAVLDGLDQLAAEQWNPIWNGTRGFTLRMDELHCGIDGDTAWAAVPWHSQGCSASNIWFDREGRATYILSRRAGRWLAVHSHHSLNPSPAANR